MLGVAGVKIPVEFDIAVAANATRSASSTPVHGQLAIPPQTYNDYVSVGPGDVILPNVTVTMVPRTLTVQPVTVKVLGLPVVVDATTLLGIVTPIIQEVLAPTGPLAARVVPLVQPIVDKVNSILLQLNGASTSPALTCTASPNPSAPRPHCTAEPTDPGRLGSTAAPGAVVLPQATAT